MPFITAYTNAGLADFHYDISTPTNCSADSIDPELPTVLFIHTSYTSDEIFEPQFSDPRLRQFNLVTVQMRGYGETRGRFGDKIYTPRESATDLWQVMENLALPRVHVFAISIGTSVALELAARHPEVILSMTLCSPISPTEDNEAVRSGRLEVFELWQSGHTFEGEGIHKKVVDVDEAVLEDCVVGASQLFFNNSTLSLSRSILGFAYVRAKRNWAGSVEGIKKSWSCCVLWYLNRQPVPDELLSKINCPVSIIHFQEDVAYAVEHAYDLARKLTSADVKPVQDLPGAHVGNVTTASEVNRVLRQTILDAESKINKRTFADVPEGGPALRTPFTDLLAPYMVEDDAHGDDSDEDSDET